MSSGKKEDAAQVYNTANINQGPVTPPGFEAIYSACRQLYPDQPNPLQVTALVKYWLGGPDPLDYISMYSNPGCPEKNVPPHWHYVSFGLSDLHGDGRVHDSAYRSGSVDSPSGFGFEMTFRLRKEQETAPPTWPAALMQALARYVFQSENTLCEGDHVPWHSSLDGSESRMQHMLMTADPQLKTITTAFGVVNFVQVVGVCEEELKAAQHWNGSGIIDLMKTVDNAGGAWLITDMRRGENVFEIDPQLQERVDQGISLEGSNLSGVSSQCSWIELSKVSNDNKENYDNLRRGSSTSDTTDAPNITDLESEQIKNALTIGLGYSKPVLPPIPSGDSSSRKASFDSNLSGDAPTELLRTRSIDAVHLKFSLEAGKLLPLALLGRLKHGRHFTFKSILNDVAITFVSQSVIGSIADASHPYAAHGPWLQVLLTDDFIDHMLRDIQILDEIDVIDLPKVFQWCEHHMTITICPDTVESVVCS
ncbi:suppressor of fused homolog [Tubulanus polymorphus]|uniref:suppressor of fused homolog n=1 Tax=Tubulanus polymorphus TaxID=672921 RepID=UPI003DA62A81